MIKNSKPLIGVILLNAAFAGMDVISMAALKHGMSSFVYLVYANLIATLFITPFALIFDRNVMQKKMNFSMFTKILLLSILDYFLYHVPNQHADDSIKEEENPEGISNLSANGNLYFMGMKRTSATFAAAMGNALPGISFLLAWLFKLEEVHIKNRWSQIKVVGTLTTVVGATIMTLMKGPVVPLPWIGSKNHSEEGNVGDIISTHPNSIGGALMISAAYFLWASYINFQAIVLKDYPAELSLTAWISLLSTAECAVFAVVMQRHDRSAWSINWDIDSFAALYNGIVCVGVGYYIQATITKTKGPVYVTAFSPLTSVMVAVIASFALSEQLVLGRVIGAVVIIGGLYLVLWGKSKDEISSSSSASSISSNEDDDPKKLQVSSNNGTNIASNNGDVALTMKQ